MRLRQLRPSRLAGAGTLLLMVLLIAGLLAIAADIWLIRRG